ncbi:hypothetical protein GCM10018783_01490 [Streptomyces griseosporeus]|nr:hypothetical protein GCM10018783_01490 [Streptomyces griseosporeus]
MVSRTDTSPWPFGRRQYSPGLWPGKPTVSIKQLTRRMRPHGPLATTTSAGAPTPVLKDATMTDGSQQSARPERQKPGPPEPVPRQAVQHDAQPPSSGTAPGAAF